ncbi:NAD(P)H-binding protein [Luteipulveratus sp. YIM 133132]|uniref:NAD(P)H-binding protein n=1 Tax=Luteipulveratus flavus TaxID=3031728 RepID=UPI0023AE6BB2|nr:NAD(P)H-binding protein [Luteipulveratus sp. YIM 133132]MDE9365858.1 NAD(P)H-binding protein [Luteipulveratus sp. YIM 133132]
MVVARAGTPSGEAIVRALADRPAGRVAVRALGVAGGTVEPELASERVAVVADVDLAAPSVADHLAGARAIVLVLAPDDLAAELAERDRRDRIATEVRTLVLAAAATSVDHLVLVTSAMVHGALPDNPVPLPDDAPRRAEALVGLVGDLVAAEEALEAAAALHPGLRTTIVRPATLVGGTDTIITRHVAAPRLLRLKDSAPAWQLCHVDDLGRAVAQVVDQDLGPTVTVACEGWLTQSELEEVSGLRTVELSGAAAQGIAHRLHRVGSLPSPATDLDFVAHPWAVAAQLLRDAGWQPQHDNRECVELLLTDARAHRMGTTRRFDRKDGAAIGAASAAVAIGATAAIVRRRRKKGSA